MQTKMKQQYQTLDGQITQAALAAANKVAKWKYSYMQNDELVNCGRRMILYKMTLDCKMRQPPPPSVLVRRALALKVPLA